MELILAKLWKVVTILGYVLLESFGCSFKMILESQVCWSKITHYALPLQRVRWRTGWFI